MHAMPALPTEAAALVAALFLLALTRLIWVLPSRRRGSRLRRSSEACVRTLAVLGSGGHTAEMLSLLNGLDHRRYSPLTLVVAETDNHSQNRASSQLSERWKSKFVRIPRSREVGQGWLSTVLCTMYAIVRCTVSVARMDPELIICNGPGTCVPVCIAAYVIRFLGLRHARIVFVESFCRTRRLSLTGRILYPFVDRFVVHWPRLARDYPRCEYLGTLL
jgi:beta-1,4-N-acetylglucosaminyltransferase